MQARSSKSCKCDGEAHSAEECWIWVCGGEAPKLPRAIRVGPNEERKNWGLYYMGALHTNLTLEHLFSLLSERIPWFPRFSFFICWDLPWCAAASAPRRRAPLWLWHNCPIQRYLIRVLMSAHIPISLRLADLCEFQTQIRRKTIVFQELCAVFLTCSA